MKKIAIIVLAFAMAFGAVSCKEKGEADISVWTTYDTVKILRDKTYNETMPAKLRFSAVKNEYESAQLIVTANKAVRSYDVELSDLKGENGEIFSAENFTVYNQKYIQVTRTTTNNFESGWYPDALLPFDTAAEYGENTIEEGENQGIWFSCYVPKTQAAGVYSGSFTINADGSSVAVPVSVEVADFTLGDEVHSRSSFGIHRYWNEGGIVSAEKDAGYGMYTAYYEYLLDYRISARYMPSSMTDIDGFIAQLRKYFANPKCSNYILPYVEAYDSDFGGSGIDYAAYEYLLDKIAAASIEDEVNYFEKASTYFAMYDEITSASDIQKANAFYKKIYDLHISVAEKWGSSLNCTEEFKRNLIETMLDINQLMVTTYSPSFTVGFTYCPLLDKYNSKSSRENYQEVYEYGEGDYKVTLNEEKWWYSAGIPKNPYPSYHIDDNGYSPVVYSWMQYANGVTGNLYWSATFYLERVNENNKVVYNALQDCYSTAMRFPETNGDGFLVYPGAPYGIYGPVGSIRLEQIRDGLEEYDMLYALDQAYREKSAAGIETDFDGVMEFLYERLFEGTKVGTSESEYEAVRKSLIDMLVMEEQTGVLVTDAQVENNVASMVIFVPDHAEISVTGEKKGETAVSGGKLITVEKPLSGAENTVEVLCGDHKMSISFGASTTVFGAETLLGVIKSSEGDTLSIDAVDGEPVAKLVMAASTAKKQSFVLQGTLAGAIGKDTERFTVKLYSDTRVDIELYFTGANGLSLPVLSTTLDVGYNELSVPVISLNWGSLGSLLQIDAEIGGFGDDTARTLSFAEIVVR